VFSVGFAAETHDVEQYAIAKLQNKNIDMIAANRVGEGALGFESDDNALDVYWQDGHAALGRDRKTRLACQLIELIATRKKAKR
jgi:phosphopantothenoylcysteine decarboxylase/phosphopantothenate--cysteine ligase